VELIFRVALLIGLFCAPVARAQVPAQPADPNQPVPAQPVVPATPVAPAVSVAPAKAASPSGSTTAPALVEPAGPTLSIVADGSLKAVLQELAQTWADDQPTSPQMPITLTNSGTMRAKIEAGSTWDLALDADVADVKEMTDRGLLLADGQRSIARNTLVVYGRSPLVKDDDLEWFDLIGTEWKKVARGNPDLTASGRVAQRALHKHDLDDDDHKGAYVYAANEATALQLLQRQQAEAAFVYRTDLASISLPGFESFPVNGGDAPPVFYTGSLFRVSKNAALARQFLDYCTSEPARAIWARYGFETN
jgi:molybdate transport system substrate-binding protein